jgi:uncharacterized Zn-binding protein involved in type VI secretion
MAALLTAPRQLGLDIGGPLASHAGRTRVTMTIPAVHIFHPWLCPIESGTGIIIGPSGPQVLVGGLLAAKLSDMCLCVAHHASPIAEGAAQVLVHGLPAARLTSTTIIGGSILQGDSSVLIGGDTFAVPSFITIEGDAYYQAKVLRDLYKISTTPSGRALLASMAATGKKLRIHPRGEGESPGGARTDTDPRRTDPEPMPGGWDYNYPGAYDKTGTDAQIGYDPDGGSAMYPKSAQTPGQSNDPTLFHEMVHADDMMHGRLDRSECKNPGGIPGYVFCGERRASGLPPYDDRKKWPYSEQTYRDERGYPLREAY